ncbi:hypothetical protein K491DRAFT_689992 [Lophiostoma macrostomum CBS 122681]|uniref:Uncharacterized protein n=1 Tax=Lophiostoma macrostomum CBS 122681 TaxID=1314788 RepID=A0A6A6TID6_9PLEO|nr:hypothetical protein K491DRAFT_689992 [Lophiostoma macrostomum CBS 122681]
MSQTQQAPTEPSTQAAEPRAPYEINTRPEAEPETESSRTYAGFKGVYDRLVPQLREASRQFAQGYLRYDSAWQNDMDKAGIVDLEKKLKPLLDQLCAAYEKLIEETKYSPVLEEGPDKEEQETNLTCMRDWIDLYHKRVLRRQTNYPTAIERRRGLVAVNEVPRAAGDLPGEGSETNSCLAQQENGRSKANSTDPEIAEGEVPSGKKSGE